MKTFRQRLLTLIVASLVLVMPSCTLKQLKQLADDKSIEASPNPIEKHGDSVSFTVEAKLPQDLVDKLQKASKKGFSYVMEVAYQPIQGEVVESWQINVTGSTPANVTETFAFAYDEDKHKDGGVMVRGYAKKGDQRFPKEEMDWTEIAKGIIRTPELVQPSFYPTYVDHGYTYTEKVKNTSLEFFFDQGSSNLKYSEKKGADAEKMGSYIAGMNATKTVTITGMHSPEGPEVINSNLANDRAMVIQKFYEDMMERYDYKDEDAQINFVIKPVVEDWSGLKTMLSGFEGITDSDKREMQNIVNGPGEFRTKELNLQKVAGYKKVFSELYPKLRTAKADIIQILPQMSEAEIIAFGYSVAKGDTEDTVGLTAQEIAFAAHSQQDLDDKKMIYEYAIKKYDEGAYYNNLGAIYLEKAQKAATEKDMIQYIDWAITQLELGAKRSESAETYVNLAGAKLMKGDEAGAEEALKKAAGKATGSAGVAVNALKGYFYITKGEYKSALENLVEGGEGSAVLYNKALAYLLMSSKNKTGDYSKAQAAFAQAIEKDTNNAHAYYGAAIVAARMNNEADMLKHLGKAVSMNNELKERAPADMEFVNYRDKEGFKKLFK